MNEAEPPTDPTVVAPGMSGSIVASTALFAAAHGMGPEEIERETGLSMTQLSAADDRFPNEVVAKIWNALIRRQSNASLPLRMARAAPMQFFGALAFGVQYSETLAHAAKTFCRYITILSDAARARLVEDETTARLLVGHPTDELDGGAGAEVGVAMARRFIDEVLQMPEILEGVELAHTPFGPLETYEEFFGVPVRFRCEHTALVFARETLQLRPNAADPRLSSYIEAHLELALQKLAQADDLAEVRAALAKNATRREYGADALAKTLGMSLRALQRYMSARGTTVRELVDETRTAQAVELLGERRLSVDEIAFVLGYSNERAFRRAFSRMTGLTPAQHRRKGS